MYFTKKDKKMAKRPYDFLAEGYDASEIELKRACKSGDKKAMRQAMKNHHDFEYALLYRLTPESKKERKRSNHDK